MLKRILFAFSIIPLLLGCDSRQGSSLLDELDSLVIAEKYDSAYHVLLRMDPKFDSEKELAHYRLLLTQTSYLTYNSLPTDSAIDAAIGYYMNGDDNEKLADAYYYKASGLHERNEDSLAILYCKKAEEIADKSKNMRLRYKIAESMVRINNQNSNYHLQLDYARKALGYAREAENKNWMAYSYFNLAMAFQYLGQVDSLTKYAKELMPRLGDIYPQDRPAFLSCIGMMYFKNGNLALARKYYNEALVYGNVPRTLVNLAEVYTEEGKDDEAYRLWQKAFLLDDDGTRDVIMFNMLQYDLKRQRNLEDACERMFRIYAIKDSLTATLKDRTIQDLQQKYDEEVTGNIYESRLMRWMIATLILVLALVVMAGYIRHRRHLSQQLTASHQMLFIKYNNDIDKLTLKCQLAERDISDYEERIADYTSQISQLQSSGEHAEQKKIELERRIGDYARKNKELEDSCKEARKQIGMLRQEIKDIVEKSSPVLNRGKILYDEILEDKNIASWSKNDYKCFVEYYKALHIQEYESIEKNYKKEHLTLRNMLFLILKEMGKDNKAISQIMGISTESVRVMKHRLLKSSMT